MDDYISNYLANELEYLSTRDNLPEQQLFYEGYRCAIENVKRMIDEFEYDD